MASEDVAAAMMRGPSFEDMRQRIWKCLTDPKIKRFSFNGWEGVGKSNFLRQVIGEFSKRAQRDYEEEGSSSNLYKIVWVEMPGSVIDLRKSIWKTMGTVGERPLTPMPNQKILLVLDYLQEPINLNDVGLYNWGITVAPDSKVVITSPSSRVWHEMKTDVDIQGSWEDLSEDEAWDLVCVELTNLATSIATSGINIGRDNIIQCFSSLLLFQMGYQSTRYALYWRAEGFISAFDHLHTRNSVCRTLLTMLKNRAMIKMDHEDDFDFIVVSDFIRPKVVPILNRGGGFLVRCDLGLEEAPMVEEWEKENLKRISLSNNNIRTLAQVAHAPPVVPHLSTLILSSNAQLCEIPDDFFQNMKGLRVLDLSHTGITSLPSSLSSLTNLRFLSLDNCRSLYTVPHPLLHALQKLEVLLLGGSSLPGLTELFLHTMQNIYYLCISEASNLTQLSLRGCSSFERLHPPHKIEMLDLSRTKIREFLDFDFSNLECLRHLDLSNTKHLKAVQWHDIDRLPQTLDWHQHSPQQSLATQEELHNNQGYCISVSDHEIFQTLSKDSKLWDEYFKKFKFSIISRDHRQQQRPKDADNPFERTHFIYRGIYVVSKKTHVTEYTRSYGKCLEIEATNDVPYGIGGVLYHTEFFSLHNNNSITQLSQLGIKNMDNLLECRIEKCKNIQSLFITGRMSANVNVLSRLEILLVFDLANLKSLCRGTFGRGSFASLKCIYLENCPRLLTLFSSSVRLEKLELLEIRFCDNLEWLFEEEDDVEGQDAFPQLKELYLFKLRKLKCICNGNLPALEKLKVQGCRSLRKLPLPVAIDSKLNVVAIGDDQDWKKHLNWEEIINIRVRPKVPRAFKIQ